jgi:hypothetical protein
VKRAKRAAEEIDVGCDFEITSVREREHGVGGTWVNGRLNGHEFCAMVFAERAREPSYEIGDSRISKLWLRRDADRAVVFNWDRGADVEAADETTQTIVGFLEVGLADLIFGEGSAR